jgi:hypothetical protein
MRIEFVPGAAKGEFDCNMKGRLDEFEIFVNALENSVNETTSTRQVTTFLRKKLTEARKRK